MTEKGLLMLEDVPWDVLIKNCDKQIPNEIRVHLQPLCHVLQSLHKNNEVLSKEWIYNTLLRLDACIDRTWESLNTGHWKNVSMHHRYCYTICSVLKCMVLEIDSKNSTNTDNKDKNEKIKAIVHQVDKGLLLGAPLEDAPNLLTNFATRLNNYFASKISSDNMDILECDEQNITKNLVEGLSWIKRYRVPSMETFYRDIFVKKVPAVLEGCMEHWKALELWKDPKYLIKIAGIRTVPIEVGSRYTEEDWSQNLVTFADFIQSHVTKHNEKVGYLAQHQLFDQIPELKKDFSIPDYCNFSDNSEPMFPDINAWFGPNGTVSPLHFDPKNNLLCQVFGCKKIFLYEPSEADNLYPFDTRLLNNTAQADPVNPDFNKFPKFKNAKGSMCFLSPGEMLFIPPGWWHHVSSLSPSFSVSFWWT